MNLEIFYLQIERDNDMKSFKEMEYLELVEEKDISEIRLDNSKKGSQEWYKARLRLKAISTEIEKRKIDDNRSSI